MAATPKKFPKGANMKLEKREERTGIDYDHDGERNEPKSHVRKVRAAAAKAKMKAACAKCKAKGMKTCAHG